MTYLFWDITSILLTVVCIIIIALAVIMTYINTKSWWPILLFIPLIVGWLWMCPFGVSSSPNRIKLYFPTRVKTFDLTEYRIERKEYADLGLRVCASGGFCGYWGIWSNQGKYVMSYLVHRKKDIYLLTPIKGGKPILLNIPNYTQVPQ